MVGGRLIAVILQRKANDISDPITAIPQKQATDRPSRRRFSMMATQLHGEGCCKMQLSANVYQVEEQSLLRVCWGDAPDLKGYEQN